MSRRTKSEDAERKRDARAITAMMASASIGSATTQSAAAGAAGATSSQTVPEAGMLGVGGFASHPSPPHPPSPHGFPVVGPQAVKAAKERMERERERSQRRHGRQQIGESSEPQQIANPEPGLAELDALMNSMTRQEEMAFQAWREQRGPAMYGSMHVPTEVGLVAAWRAEQRLPSPAPSLPQQQADTA